MREVGRKNRRVFAGENAEFVREVLCYVEALRSGYSSGPDKINDCESIVEKIHGLLRSDDVGSLLDTMLAEQQGTRPARTLRAFKGDWVKDEIELCSYFGYSAREVKRYVRVALQRPESTAPQVEMSSVHDLRNQLDELHARAKEAMTSPASWLKPFERRKTIKKNKRAQRDAHDDLFCIGAIIADGMSPGIFRNSYAVALAGLSR